MNNNRKRLLWNFLSSPFPYLALLVLYSSILYLAISILSPNAVKEALLPAKCLVDTSHAKWEVVTYFIGQDAKQEAQIPCIIDYCAYQNVSNTRLPASIAHVQDLFVNGTCFAHTKCFSAVERVPAPVRIDANKIIFQEWFTCYYTMTLRILSSIKMDSHQQELRTMYPLQNVTFNASHLTVIPYTVLGVLNKVLIYEYDFANGSFLHEKLLVLYPIVLIFIALLGTIVFKCVRDKWQHSTHSLTTTMYYIATLLLLSAIVSLLSFVINAPHASLIKLSYISLQFDLQYAAAVAVALGTVMIQFFLLQAIRSYKKEAHVLLTIIPYSIVLLISILCTVLTVLFASTDFSTITQYASLTITVLVLVVVSILLTRYWKPPVALILFILFSFAVYLTTWLLVIQTFFTSSLVIQLVIAYSYKVAGFLFSSVMPYFALLSKQEKENHTIHTTGMYMLYSLSISLTSMLSRMFSMQAFASNPSTLVFFEIAGFFIDVASFYATFSLEHYRIMKRVQNIILAKCKRQLVQIDPALVVHNEKQIIKTLFIRYILDVIAIVQTPFFCLWIHWSLWLQMDPIVLLSLSVLQLAMKMMSLFVVLVSAQRVFATNDNLVAQAFSFVISKPMLFIPFVWLSGVMMQNIITTVAVLPLPFTQSLM